VAIVLSGNFVEAGLSGRIWAGPGCAIVHRDFSSHSDQFGQAGAEVLNLPMPNLGNQLVGSVQDPDRIAKLASQDPTAATEEFITQFNQQDPSMDGDWPDLLANELIANPALSITNWADDHSLDPASVSRGFRRVFGISPKRFRLEAKVARAMEGIGSGGVSAARMALDCGFADQAHMCRAFRLIVGHSPESIRQSSFNRNAS
jgi:AraC-like DNA-binding protein